MNVPVAPPPKHIPVVKEEKLMTKKPRPEIETPDEKLLRKGVSFEVDGEKLQIISRVRTFDGDIRAFSSRMKTIQERMLEIIEVTDENEAVEEAQGTLDNAKAALKRRLESNSEFMKLTEDLADEKLSIKDAKDNMSDFLLAYFADTHEKQIELGPGDAKEVIIKARLGKSKDFQTNLFSQVPSDD